MRPTRRDTPFREAMRSLLVFDGAMGSLLYERGIFVMQNFEQLNVTRPDVVAKIHEDYVNAGANIIRLAANDPNLDGLRDDPRFKQMLASAKERVCIQPSVPATPAATEGPPRS